MRGSLCYGGMGIWRVTGYGGRGVRGGMGGMEGLDVK